MMTSGLIRSLGLSFISISAGSTLSRPVNVWVISFSGWMRPDMTGRFPVLHWDIPAASPPAWILLFVRAAVLLEVVSGAKKLEKPNITVTVNNDARTAKITWKKVTNAIGYELQYKVNDGAFTSLGLVAGTVYTHENLFVGNTYTYRLIALSDKAETCSDYSAEKDIAIVCAKPVLTTSNNEAGKPVLNWDAVEGAVAYEIQIATAAKGKYKQLAVVTAVEFIHVDAEAAKTNYYKVCAIDANGTAGAFSAYKSAI